MENQLGNLPTHFGLEGIFSKYFYLQEEGFHVRTALSLFAVKALCHLPSVIVLLGRNRHLRTGPMERRVRNECIRNAHIYPCDFAGYQKEQCRRKVRFIGGQSRVPRARAARGGGGGSRACSPGRFLNIGSLK